jgi:NAD-dependent DNA ligase
LDHERIAQLQEIGFIPQSAPTPATHPETPVAIDYPPLPNGFTLLGRTLAITGRLDHFSRDEATLAAQSGGATVLDKMSGKVELLVVGHDAASKLEAARRRGIPVISEAQFAALVGKDVSRDSIVGAGETAPVNPN